MRGRGMQGGARKCLGLGRRLAGFGLGFRVYGISQGCRSLELVVQDVGLSVEFSSTVGACAMSGLDSGEAVGNE